MSLSFLQNTIYRSELPSSEDFFYHLFDSLGQLLHVYKLHVAHESNKVAEKRRMKIEDADKRQEFLRVHGVEPGFLTGTWMDKFGTIESDQIREEMRQEKERKKAEAEASGSPDQEAQEQQTHTMRVPKKKPKMWLGIWE